MKKTLGSVEFEYWIKRHMIENGITTFLELADKLGTTRMTLYRWIREPGCIKKVHLLAIMNVLNIEDEDPDELLKSWCKS